ncbi:phage integrase [Photorhabdus hindustanensis]|uniref:phage integrase n=1 Tax=Photorhabdus hindustanensis TaxID=2918802 RepID=UPI003BB5C59D
MRQLNNPKIGHLTKRVIMEHRGKRLADGISAKTVNRDIYRLSGMLSTLIKIYKVFCSCLMVPTFTPPSEY